MRDDWDQVEFNLAPNAVQTLVGRAVPGCRVRGVERLSQGWANANYRVDLESPHRTVRLRLVLRDPATVSRESSIRKLLGGEVPIPHILHSEPDNPENGLPFVVLDWMEGAPWRRPSRILNRGIPSRWWKSLPALRP